MNDQTYVVTRTTPRDGKVYLCALSGAWTSWTSKREEAARMMENIASAKVRKLTTTDARIRFREGRETTYAVEAF